MTRHMPPKEVDELIQQVSFFAHSAQNKCWPTARPWTLKEAKEALAVAAISARQALKQIE